jgi:hypothetical protein
MRSKVRTPITISTQHYITQVPWLMPGTLDTKEEQIRRIMVQSQPGQMDHETLSWEYLTHTHTHTHTQRKYPI